ncbi:MAG: helix-turn-helix domain-containing protein [Paraclostridium sp.]
MRIRDSRSFNFTIIENDIIDDVERFDKNDLLCYMALCRFANNETAECFPSYKTISSKMRVGLSTAIKSVKSLSDKGVIKIEKRKDDDGGDSSNLYTILNITAKEKADSQPQKSATKKSKSNNSIRKEDKKYTGNNSNCNQKNKNGIKCVNETFKKHGDNLEEVLQDSQKQKYEKEKEKDIEKNIVIFNVDDSVEEKNTYFNYLLDEGYINEFGTVLKYIELEV